MLVDFGHQLMTKKYTNYQNSSSEDTKQIVKFFIIISKLHYCMLMNIIIRAGSHIILQTAYRARS